VKGDAESKAKYPVKLAAEDKRCGEGGNTFTVAHLAPSTKSEKVGERKGSGALAYDRSTPCPEQHIIATYAREQVPSVRTRAGGASQGHMDGMNTRYCTVHLRTQYG